VPVGAGLLTGAPDEPARSPGRLIPESAGSPDPDVLRRQGPPVVYSKGARRYLAPDPIAPPAIPMVVGGHSFWSRGKKNWGIG
jgi:hypothetical protein